MNWLKNKRKISGQDLREMLKRIDRAYRILELNKREPMIIEKNRKESLFEIRSTKEKDKFYRVDTEIQMCTCPDFNFRFLKCKHIIAAEFASGVTS
jgi:predicted nucleic acid-binding Zn finger protein